ncbi:MAG: TetR/AcrR family transcriptional regulator [Microbacteriaceae bacterium]
MAHTPVLERRQALIEAAVRVVADQGLARATIRAIVSEAGMSLASFHYAFESRDELIDELIVTMVARERAAVVPTFHPNSSTREVIEAGLLGYFEHLRMSPQHEQAMLELTQYALRSPERSSLAQTQYASYMEIAISSLTLASEHTGTRWTVPVQTVARLMLAITDGLTLSWLVDRDDEAARAALVAAAGSLAQLAEPR